MITSQDLQRLNRTVADARNAQSFDQARYDAAHAEYMRAIEQWAEEGKQIASTARYGNQTNK